MNPVDDVGRQLIAFLPNMRRFALSLCRSATLADDLVQLACERALGSAGSFVPGTRFDAWMFRIIRNLWIDEARRARTAGVQDPIEDHQERLAGADQGVAEARLLLGKVWDAMGDLSEEQREVMLLVCVEDFSYRDAAETLNVPIGTVMSRLARARENIAKRLGMNEAAGRSSREPKDPSR